VCKRSSSFLNPLAIQQGHRVDGIFVPITDAAVAAFFQHALPSTFLHESRNRRPGDLAGAGHAGCSPSSGGSLIGETPTRVERDSGQEKEQRHGEPVLKRGSNDNPRCETCRGPPKKRPSDTIPGLDGVFGASDRERDHCVFSRRGKSRSMGWWACTWETIDEEPTNPSRAIRKTERNRPIPGPPPGIVVMTQSVRYRPSVDGRFGAHEDRTCGEKAAAEELQPQLRRSRGLEDMGCRIDALDE